MKSLSKEYLLEVKNLLDNLGLKNGYIFKEYDNEFDEGAHYVTLTNEYYSSDNMNYSAMKVMYILRGLITNIDYHRYLFDNGTLYGLNTINDNTTSEVCSIRVTPWTSVQ